MKYVGQVSLSETHGMNKRTAPGTDPAGTLPITYPAVPIEADRLPPHGAHLGGGLISIYGGKRGYGAMADC
jgi:hypothetical protein